MKGFPLAVIRWFGLMPAVVLMGAGSAYVAAACSADYAGLATINEISDKNQNNFIEVKVLTSSIGSDVYSQWKLEFCSTDGKNNPTISCSDERLLSDADASGYPWLIMYEDALGGTEVNLAGMDVRLKDGAGATIDYVRVGGQVTAAVDPECGADPGDLPYGNRLELASGNSGQFARRMPDGTGEWSLDSGASAGKSTESTTNDSDATGPDINVVGASVFSGEAAVFSITLSEAAGEDITLEYTTLDGSALAPEDYESRSGTLTIPAGAEFGEISISTVTDNEPGIERFFVRLLSASEGILVSQIGVGEILPAPVALWKFEAGPWSSSADEVIDSSGNSLHGRAYGGAQSNDTNPARTGNPGTCGYAQFEGRFADYEHIEVNDNPLLDLPSEMTVAVWVRPDRFSSIVRSTVISKGGNYALHIYSDGEVHWTWTDQVGNERQLDASGSPLPTDAWSHIAVTYESGQQRLYINGVLRGSASFIGQLEQNRRALLFAVDQSFVGEFRYFDGAIDEARIYSAALPASAVNSIYQHRHLCTGSSEVGRIELSTPLSASVCAPTNVQLTAYDSNDNVLTDYEGTVNLSTSNGHGRWAADGQNGLLAPFPDSSDDGIATYQFSPVDGGTATLAFSNSHADTLRFQAVDSQAGVNVESDPVAFALNSLSISSTDPLADDLIAGRRHEFRVDMLRQDPDSGQCAIASEYDGSYALKAWLERSAADPGGEAPELAVAGGETIQPPDARPASSNLSVGFTGGSASFVLAPADVGRYSLNLLDDASGFAQDLGGAPLPVFSTTPDAPWTVRPFGLSVHAPGNPAAADAAGGVFRAAGEIFTLEVGGALYQQADDADGNGVADDGADLADNGYAASFGKEGEIVSLAAKLLAPATGDNPGLSGPALEPQDFSNGLASRGGFGFSEVGIIDVEAKVADGNYLSAGAGRTARITVDSGPIGRFVPDRFHLEVLEKGMLASACGGLSGFTYSGQGMDWLWEPRVRVDPLNVGGNLTRNYLVGEFMKLTEADVDRSWPVVDQSAVLANPTGTAYPVTVSAEQGIIEGRNDLDPVVFRYSDEDSFVYQKSASARIAPFTPSLLLTIEDVTDSDGVAAASAVPLALEPESAGDVRYGRRSMENVYGPESASLLTMPFRMEHWDGNGFALNTLDDCTAWDTAASVLDDPEVHHELVNEGDTGLFTAGLAGPLKLKPSGTQGSDLLSWQLPVWQQDDWSASGTLTNPSALATFGVYRGHDRIIYWREAR